MPRLVMPSRRPSETFQVDYTLASGEAAPQLVTVGYEPTSWRPREVFISSHRTGSDLDMMLADFAVAVSVALQSGTSAASMAKSIARVPKAFDGPAVQPASVFGAVLDLLAQLEKGEL